MGEPEYEKNEIEDGFQPIWISYNKVLVLDGVRETVDHYEGKFVVERERTILEEAIKSIEKQ